MSAKSRKPLRLLAAALAVLAALGAIEVGGRLIFRLSHRRFLPEAVNWIELQPGGPRLMPNVHSDIFARVNGQVVRLNVNSLGLRGPELDARHSRPRLLFLGDSIVFGPGVEETDTVPGALQAQSSGAEILNGGVPGQGTREEVDLLQEVWPRAQPDAALIGFYLNDGRRSVFLDEQRGGYSRAVRAINWLRRRSMVFNELWSRLVIAGIIPSPPVSIAWIAPFIQGKWKTDRAAYEQVLKLAGDDFGSAWTDEPWPGIERELDRFGHFCSGHAVRPGLVIFPVAMQVEASFVDARPQDRVREICRRNGIPCLDLLPILRAHAGEKLFIDHCHLTPLGARVVAQEVRTFLAGAGILPDRGPALSVPLPAR